ncbi:MAG: hypothetical protein ABEK01_04715 [Candidatus Nanohaloarchaea archaeon]
MKREEELVREVSSIIESGDRPHVELLAERMSWTDQDVHRVLNILEKKDEVFTYPEEFLDEKKRMVGLKRQ